MGMGQYGSKPKIPPHFVGPQAWPTSTFLSKSHSASIAAKCAHQAEIVLAAASGDRKPTPETFQQRF